LRINSADPKAGAKPKPKAKPRRKKEEEEAELDMPLVRVVLCEVAQVVAPAQ